jgi:DNA-directed RNA polymerase sigma subunit (sigma70/sigma32)
MNQGLSFGFNDDGERVGVVGFTYPGDADASELRAEDSAKLRQETLSRTLDLLCDGATDAATIGRRVAVMAFLSRGESRPRTLAELGRLLGVTRARACQC